MVQAVTENRGSNDLLLALEQRFGPFMSSSEVRGLLKFKTPSALAMARKRGYLHLDAHRMRGRRQLMFSTAQVARAVLDSVAVQTPTRRCV